MMMEYFLLLKNIKIKHEIDKNKINLDKNKINPLETTNIEKKDEKDQKIILNKNDMILKDILDKPEAKIDNENKKDEYNIGKETGKIENKILFKNNLSDNQNDNYKNKKKNENKENEEEMINKGETEKKPINGIIDNSEELNEVKNNKLKEGNEKKKINQEIIDKIEIDNKNKEKENK